MNRIVTTFLAWTLPTVIGWALVALLIWSLS